MMLQDIRMSFDWIYSHVHSICCACHTTTLLICKKYGDKDLQLEAFFYYSKFNNSSEFAHQKARMCIIS